MDIFGQLGAIVPDIADAVVKSFTSLSGIFWTPGATSSDPGSPTLVLYLILGGIVLSLIVFALTKIFGLAKLKK